MWRSQQGLQVPCTLCLLNPSLHSCPLCSWVERLFLPTVNKQGADGWDMMRTVAAIRAQANKENDEPSKIATDALQVRQKCHDSGIVLAVIDW